jgi:hypothetical protein
MDTNLDTFYNNIIGSNVIFAQFNTVMHVGTLTSNTKSISRIISLLSYNEYKNIANCNGSSCNGNYLTNTNFWLADGTGSKSTSNYYVSTNGSVSTSTSSLTIKPTLMATNVVITGGSGSSSDPYVVYYDNRAS